MEQVEKRIDELNKKIINNELHGYALLENEENTSKVFIHKR